MNSAVNAKKRMDHIMTMVFFAGAVFEYSYIFIIDVR